MPKINSAADLHLRGSVAVITLDHPPVNALSQPLREGVLLAVEAASADDAVKAIVIACAGRTFIAGADIAEFGKPVQEPTLWKVLEAIEAAGKPTVAAIHGTALGGGLELALACHYRVAAPSARVGFPEVTLGIIPGAGGTQRAPRLVGVEKALAMITGGAPLTAAEAHAAGLIDELVDGDLVEGAVAFAERQAGRTGHLLVRDRDELLVPFRDRPEFFAEQRAKVVAKAKGSLAPPAAVDAVQAAVDLPFDEGIAREQAIAEALVASPESAARRYAFFAERETAKIPGLDPKAAPVDVKAAAVVGAGQMGSLITVALVNAGIPTTLVEQNRQNLDRGLDIIRKVWERQTSQGRLEQGETERRMGMITPSLSIADIRDADLVIEAVYEAMPVKTETFARIEAHAKPGAILATNTSTLDIDVIAAATRRPQDVIGLHFFSPAHVMRLLEVVRGARTSDTAIATALALGKRLKKVPVLSRVCHGFIGNRLFRPRNDQSRALIVAGASPRQVDNVLKDFGFPMGTFDLQDMAHGIELGWRMNQDSGHKDLLNETLYERGRLGQRAKKGYFAYGDDGRTPIDDPEVDEILEMVAKAEGVTRRKVSDEEILERLLYPMVNEAAKILEEGVAIRPSDIDIVWITGYGWPIHRGGITYWADQQGLDAVVATLRKYEPSHGQDFEPAALLQTLASEGRRFSDFKAA